MTYAPAHDTLAGHAVILDWDGHKKMGLSGGDDFAGTGNGFTLLSPVTGDVSFIAASAGGVDLHGIRVRHSSGYSIGALELKRRLVTDGQYVTVGQALAEGGLYREGETKAIHMHGYDPKGNRITYAAALARIAAADAKIIKAEAAVQQRLNEQQKVIDAWRYLHSQPHNKGFSTPRGVLAGKRSIQYNRMVQREWRRLGHRDITVTGIIGGAGSKTRNAEAHLAQMWRAL